MPTYRRNTAVLLIGAWLWTLLCVPACAASPSEAERRYQQGLSAYAQGHRALALASFKESLRLNPKSPSARAAVMRIELEAAQADSARSVPTAAPKSAVASSEGTLDDLLLRQVPRYFRFERTVGDARADQGTLAAMQGRVAQMLSERRHARVRGRSFDKERELRELVRRLPAVLA